MPASGARCRSAPRADQRCARHEEKARIKELERENRELRQANEILKKASAYFAQVRPAGRECGAQRSTALLRPARAANDRLHRPTSQHLRARRAAIEPICKTLPIAPSTYYAAKAAERTPDRASPRSKRDADLKEVMSKLWKDNHAVYGYKKLWFAPCNGPCGAPGTTSPAARSPLRGGPLHGATSDAGNGHPGCRSRQEDHHH